MRNLVADISTICSGEFRIKGIDMHEGCLAEFDAAIFKIELALGIQIGRFACQADNISQNQLLTLAPWTCPRDLDCIANAPSHDSRRQSGGPGSTRPDSSLHPWIRVLQASAIATK